MTPSRAHPAKACCLYQEYEHCNFFLTSHQVIAGPGEASLHGTDECWADSVCHDISWHHWSPGSAETCDTMFARMPQTHAAYHFSDNGGVLLKCKGQEVQQTMSVVARFNPANACLDTLSLFKDKDLHIFLTPWVSNILPTHLASAEGQHCIVAIAGLHLHRVDDREDACTAHHLGQLLYRGILKSDAAQLALVSQSLHCPPSRL